MKLNDILIMDNLTLANIRAMIITFPERTKIQIKQYNDYDHIFQESFNDSFNYCLSLKVPFTIDFLTEDNNMSIFLRNNNDYIHVSYNVDGEPMAYFEGKPLDYVMDDYNRKLLNVYTVLNKV